VPRIPELVADLTVEEKAALLEGTDSWFTNAIPRLGIPALRLTDGPHGVRVVRESRGGFGVADNEHSTSFPTSATVAASWNPDNLSRMGRAIARECLALGVNVLLAPGVNIKRSPLCGRNFEYYSEDPLLSGVLGAAFVNGVQSNGVGCSVKHFAANSNENYRFTGDSIVDERALREIYLRAFERIVKTAKPYSVMCSYNRLNGIPASQNRELLTGILRDEWGFDGLVVTDWGAARDRIEGVVAGCDLDMPGSVWHNRKSIIDAARSGALAKEVLDRAVTRVLALVEKCTSGAPDRQYDRRVHANLSCEIAADSAVLLKNDGVLPLARNQELLVVGEMFEKIRYQGAGSSLINPREVISPRDAFDRRSIRYTYEKGYRCFYTERDNGLEQAALEAATRAEVVLFFGGLSDFEESEGFDREHLQMSEVQAELLEALIAGGKKVVLVLYAGAPVAMPFLDGLSALLDMCLPGMYGGEATAALLFGEATPSGKLAESWPLRAEDSCCFADYDLGPTARYYESVYVGYRFYDKAGITLRFPFGYGLSYTSFEYRSISVSDEGEDVVVQTEVSNVGERDGSEIVQLYVRYCSGERVFRPEKELRAFAKVFLKPGESKTVRMEFRKTDLACWNVKRHDWVVENGTYEICVAASAADIRLTALLTVTDGQDEDTPYPDTVTTAYAKPPRGIPPSFGELVGPTASAAPEDTGLTLDSSLSDLRRTTIGRILYVAIMRMIRKDYRMAKRMPNSLERDARLKNAHFLVRMIPSNSIRSLCMSSSGRFTYSSAGGLVELANGHVIRGLGMILEREKALPLPGERSEELSIPGCHPPR
jgi:beta-glucosidase